MKTIFFVNNLHTWLFRGHIYEACFQYKHYLRIKHERIKKIQVTTDIAKRLWSILVLKAPVYSNSYFYNYRGDGVDGVHYSEQKNVVNTSWVVRVPRPRDLLACGVVDKGRVARNINLVVCSIRHGCGRSIHVFVLHQRLAFLGHYDYIAGKSNKEVR